MLADEARISPIRPSSTSARICCQAGRNRVHIASMRNTSCCFAVANIASASASASAAETANGFSMRIAFPATATTSTAAA